MDPTIFQRTHSALICDEPHTARTIAGSSFTVSQCLTKYQNILELFFTISNLIVQYFNLVWKARGLVEGYCLPVLPIKGPNGIKEWVGWFMGVYYKGIHVRNDR